MYILLNYNFTVDKLLRDISTDTYGVLNSETLAMTVYVLIKT